MWASTSSRTLDPIRASIVHALYMYQSLDWGGVESEFESESAAVLVDVDIGLEDRVSSLHRPRVPFGLSACSECRCGGGRCWFRSRQAGGCEFEGCGVVKGVASVMDSVAWMGVAKAGTTWSWVG